jgi:hypothetical protein
MSSLDPDRGCELLEPADNDAGKSGHRLMIPAES